MCPCARRLAGCARVQPGAGVRHGAPDVTPGAPCPSMRELCARRVRLRRTVPSASDVCDRTEQELMHMSSVLQRESAADRDNLVGCVECIASARYRQCVCVHCSYYTLISRVLTPYANLLIKIIYKTNTELTEEAEIDMHGMVLSQHRISY